MSVKGRILLVDDDAQSLESTCKLLRFSDYEVRTATDGQAALDAFRAGEFDLVLTDVRMPRLGGLELLRALELRGARVPVILMTAFGRVEDAVWAMKFGAVDFLTKPFKRLALIEAVESALARTMGLRAQVTGTASASDHRIIGTSEPIQSLRHLITQLAPTSATVLISGESGTGKELIARQIHQQSPRARSKFIALNCAAIPEQLIESELFGVERGAFTGAGASREGLFEAANGGTLLLDEIGDMPLSLQAKLLRALQEGEVRRVGATASRKVDVRVIAASHRNLAEAATQGLFRQDLLYRLEVISLHAPALRERIEDVPELAAHFLRAAAKRHGKEIRAVSPEVMRILQGHAWPGNVRELSNVIERAVVFARNEEIVAADLPPHLLTLTTKNILIAAPHQSGQSSISVPLGTSLKDVEELLIRKTLEATDGDKTMTAKLLGINSRTIYRKLDKRT